MKQNPCPVVGEVTEPTGICLDELDGTVEAFCTGVADSVFTEVEQPDFVAPEHLDGLERAPGQSSVGGAGVQVAAHGIPHSVERVLGAKAWNAFRGELEVSASAVADLLNRLDQAVQFDRPGYSGRD